MAIQTIGLEARFDTSKFVTGLNTYIDGLKQAELATRRAAKAMSGLGSNLSAAFNKGGGVSKTLVPAVRRLTTGFQRTNQVVSQTGHIFNRNLALLEATQAQIRDNIRLAELRALRESKNTSEYQKQLAFLEQLSIKSSSIQRKASLRQQGFAPQQIAGTVKAAGAAKIDPLKDFSPGVLKKLNADLTTATSKTERFRKALSGLRGSATEASQGMKGLSATTIALGVAMGQVAFAAVSRISAAIGRLASEGIETAVFFERLGLSINFFAARTVRAEDASLGFKEALSQTQEEAQALLLWVKQLAVASPFTAKQVGTVFRVSQAYGLLAEEAQVLLPLLIDLGSATGLDPQTLENAARALGQIRSRGKLTGEEIRQLGNAGIPIRDILVKQLQITQKEFDGLLESGALISDSVIPAIVDSLKDFEGAAEEVAFETIGGLLSAFEDIKDIALGEFFSAALKPIKPLLLDLVETLNDPSFRAALLLIGEDVGVVITNAVKALTTAVQGLIKAWKALSPEARRNIILFAATFVGVIALIGAFSLLLFAITALVNPVTIVAFLIADWITFTVSGFSVVAEAAQAMGRAIFAVIGGIGEFVSKATAAIFGTSATLDSELEAVGENAREFGRGTGEQFGIGLAEGGVAGVTTAVGEIAGVFTDAFRPSSPPEALPQIDEWGYGVGLIYGTSIGDGAAQAIHLARAQQADAMQRLIKSTSDGAIAAWKKEEVRFINAGKASGGALWDGWTAAYQDRIDSFVEEIPQANEPAEAAAYEAGIRVGDAYTRGFGLLFRKPGDIVNPAIEKLVNAIGGGRQLSKSGAMAFSGFLEGFLDADFGALDTASGLVENFLGSLASLGELEDVDLPRQLFATREALAKAIGEARKFGKISSDAFKRVREAAAPLGGEVNEFLTLYTNLVVETEAVTRAQEELNRVTEHYDGLLDPLKDKLSEASNERQTAQEIKQIAGLQRILNSSITTEENKRIAAAQIIEIQTRQQIRALEIQRTQEERLAKDAVDAAEEKEEAAQSELSLFEQRLNAQLEQLGLVADEAKIIERLQKQLDKTNEKEATVLERQLKFAGLQKAELADTLAAAKAKVTLEDESSTEQEKAAANLQLQTIALNRLNREQEATKLGFDPADLLPYRELAITLDDIGKGAKEAGGEIEKGVLDLSGLDEPKKLAAEFAEDLKNVGIAWEETKRKFLEGLVAINEKLPPFLKLFGDDITAENVPIIETLTKIGKAILYIGVTWKIIDFAGKIVFLIDKLKILAGLGKAGGVLWSFIGWLGAFVGISATAALGWILLAAAIAAFAAAVIFNIGGTRDYIKAFIDDLKQQIERATVFIDAGAETLRLKIRALFDPSVAIADINYDEIFAQKLAEVDARHLAEGSPFDRPEFRESFIISGTQGGQDFVKFLETGIRDNTHPLTSAAHALGFEGSESFNKGVGEGFTASMGVSQFFADAFGVPVEVLIGAEKEGEALGSSLVGGIPVGMEAALATADSDSGDCRF
jgi:tape measure domain-containing protein